MSIETDGLVAIPESFTEQWDPCWPEAHGQSDDRSVGLLQLYCYMAFSHGVQMQILYPLLVCCVGEVLGPDFSEMALLYLHVPSLLKKLLSSTFGLG